MTIKSTTDGGLKKTTQSLPIRNLTLNLTARRSVLKEGEASVIVGRDVLTPGALARATGRRPIGAEQSSTMVSDLNLNSGGHPLTSAIPCNMQGLMTKRKSVYSGNLVSASNTFDPQVWQYVQVAKDQGLLALTVAGESLYGPILGDMLDPLNGPRLLFDDLLPPQGPRQSKTITIAHGRGPLSSGTGEVVAFDKREFTDKERFGNSVEYTDFRDFFAGLTTFRFTLLWTKFFDKRGMWVSNGRKFWLLQDGIYTEYLDLGPDSGALGAEWRGTQVSPNVFMFVSPKQPPRVITLDAAPRTGAVNEVDSTRYLAGIMAPDFPDTMDQSGARFQAIHSGIGSDPNTQTVIDPDLSSGKLDGRIDFNATNPPTYRVRVRCVDDVTGAASAFVDAIAVIGGDLSRSSLSVDVTQSSIAIVLPQWQVAAGIDQYNPSNWLTQNLSFRSARATHVEFWRTLGAGVSFYRELRRGIAWPKTSFLEGFPLNTALSTTLTSPSDPSIGFQFGRHMALNQADGDLVFKPNLDPVTERIGGLPPVCRDVISILGCTLAGGASNGIILANMQGKTLRWPRVAFDEQIRYSELNAGLLIVAPESFHPSDSRVVGRQGDTFQRFASTERFVIAVYRNTVHRIQRQSTDLDIQSLGAFGSGSPWAEAVISAGKLVLWVNSKSIFVYDQEANQGSGQLSPLEHGPMLKWFTDALQAGMGIDAGYDDRHGTLHLRRSVISRLSGITASENSAESDQLVNRLAVDQTDPVSSSTVPIEWTEPEGGVAAANTASVKYTFDSAAILNLQTGVWSLVEQDNGFRYVWCSRIEGDAVYRLYTITQNGAVFEENHQGLSHPYDGYTVQGKRGSSAPDFAGASNSIVSRIGAVFTPYMLGDVVRWRSTNPLLDGVLRTINSVNATTILFDDLGVSPANGDEFIIGAQPFRVRWAPVADDVSGTIKTVTGLQVLARPGNRHQAASSWGQVPIHGLTVKAYEELADESTPPNGTAKVFAARDVEFVTTDREGGVIAQAMAVEIEIESLDARTDFEIDAIEVNLTEEGDQMDDVTTVR